MGSKMVTNISQIITQSLQKQVDQVTMQQNDDENVIEGKLLFANDAKQFHTLEKNIIYHAKNT